MRAMALPGNIMRAFNGAISISVIEALNDEGIQGYLMKQTPGPSAGDAGRQGSDRAVADRLQSDASSESSEGCIP